MRVCLTLLLALLAASVTNASSIVRGSNVADEDVVGMKRQRDLARKRRSMDDGRGELHVAKGETPVVPPREVINRPQPQPAENEMIKTKRKHQSSKKKSSKGSKLVQPMKAGGKNSKKRGMRMGKGKGKGKGNGPMPGCTSPVADAILGAVDDVITRNPSWCCNFDGPTAVYVTHAQRDEDTNSGFEPFWDAIYKQIVETSRMANVCFVMTGYDQDNTDRNLSEILVEVNEVTSNLPTVQAMMVTDPTENGMLLEQIREISNNEALPSIGVFNAGYGNLLIESIVSGMERLPFVGILDDAEYGEIAGKLSLDLLGDVAGVPLCFNARPDLDFVGQRCAAYYAAITFAPIVPPTGEVCSSSTGVDEIFNSIVNSGANALFSHEDCCSAVSRAAELARMMDGRTIVVGCSDADTTGGDIDFVTALPIELQAYQASSWANFPVIQAQQGEDGRGEQYFPSLMSLVNTNIFNQIIL